MYLTGYLHRANSQRMRRFLLYSLLISLVYAGNLKQNWGETMGFILGNTTSQETFDGQDYSRTRMSLVNLLGGGGGASRDLE